MLTYKILVIGDSGVGKTIFIQKSLGKSFQICPITMSVKISNLFIQHDSQEYKLYIYDLGGNLDTAILQKKIFQKANAVLLMYNSNITSSYLNLPIWKHIVDLYCDNIPIIVYDNSNYTYNVKPLWNYILNMIK